MGAMGDQKVSMAFSFLSHRGNLMAFCFLNTDNPHLRKKQGIQKGESKNGNLKESEGRIEWGFMGEADVRSWR
jgi:hypothetical protein